MTGLNRVSTATTSATPSATVPLASIVVPCRNEAAHIAPCVESLLDGGYPRDRIEILVVDGMSDDGTRAVLDDLVSRHPEVRVLENRRRVTPVALNMGVQHASGGAVLICGAHTRYPEGYVATLMRWLERSGADAVGGVCETTPADGRPVARAIAAAMSHPFGVGNAHFRTGVSEPRWVDTVAFGCYRRDVFARVGNFDEELVRNQDDEYNARILRRGGRLLLVPDVTSRYAARGSLAALWRMYWQYGRYKPLVIRKVGQVVTVRQLVPAAFVAALVLGVAALPLGAPAAWALGALCAAYLTGALASGAQLARRVGPSAGLLAAAVFPVLHLSYGAGFLVGACALLLGRRAVPGAPIPLSR
jgi:glycosyltransferase involved in cell wall biosynthesis